MSLTEKEKQRKNELINKYKHSGRLTQNEIFELKMLIQRDNEIDDDSKMLMLFGLGAISSTLSH